MFQNIFYIQLFDHELFIYNYLYLHNQRILTPLASISTSLDHAIFPNLPHPSIEIICFPLHSFPSPSQPCSSSHSFFSPFSSSLSSGIILGSFNFFAVRPLLKIQTLIKMIHQAIDRYYSCPSLKHWNALLCLDSNHIDLSNLDERVHFGFKNGHSQTA